jgi:predicted NBD/HSP70 family sugar kinase
LPGFELIPIVGHSKQQQEKIRSQMRALAVDLGGTHVAYGVVDDRRLIFHKTFEVVSATRLCSVLATLEVELRQAQKMYGKCDGLAMGFP